MAIDRIAIDGMTFTGCDAEPLGTAGRSGFITGQCTPRRGMSEVGIPGAAVVLRGGTQKPPVAGGKRGGC